MQTKTGLDQQTKSVDGSLRLRVGRIQGVFVYKLIREIQVRDLFLLVLVFLSKLQ